MVAGKLEARGRSSNKITFTLKEEKIEEPEMNIETTETPLLLGAGESENGSPVRLYGGRTAHEGRLQVSTCIRCPVFFT